MATLQHSHYFEIEVDGKKIKGDCKRKKYEDWNQGFFQSDLQSMWYPDGLHFEPLQMTIVTHDDSLKLREAFTSKGKKEINIVTVILSDHSSTTAYEVERVEAFRCDFLHCSRSIDTVERHYFFHVSYNIKKKILITENIPDGDDGKLKKIGPYGWDFELKERI